MSEVGGRRSGRAIRAVRVICIALIASAFGLAACGRHELPAIRQRGAWLVVENQTKSPWTNVTVTLNAYYRGVSPTLSAGGRLQAPPSGFVTGAGQRVNAARGHINRRQGPG